MLHSLASLYCALHQMDWKKCGALAQKLIGLWDGTNIFTAHCARSRSVWISRNMTFCVSFTLSFALLLGHDWVSIFFVKAYVSLSARTIDRGGTGSVLSVILPCHTIMIFYHYLLLQHITMTTYHDLLPWPTTINLYYIHVTYYYDLLLQPISMT